MKCPGLHCDGCRSGSGALGALAVLVVLVVGASVAPAVERAASAVLRVVVDVLEITAIALASIAGLGLITGGVLVGVRVRRRVLARRQRAALRGAPVVYLVGVKDAPELPASHPPAWQDGSEYSGARRGITARPGTSAPPTRR